MRSRRGTHEPGRLRDHIEAGLNEPRTGRLAMGIVACASGPGKMPVRSDSPLVGTFDLRERLSPTTARLMVVKLVRADLQTWRRPPRSSAHQQIAPHDRVTQIPDSSQEGRWSFKLAVPN